MCAAPFNRPDVGSGYRLRCSGGNSHYDAGHATGEAAETCQVGADAKIALVHLGKKMTFAAGLGAAWVPVKRRIDVCSELGQLHGSRWISDVARFYLGAGSQRKQSASRM